MILAHPPTNETHSSSVKQSALSHASHDDDDDDGGGGGGGGSY